MIGESTSWSNTIFFSAANEKLVELHLLNNIEQLVNPLTDDQQKLVGTMPKKACHLC